MTVKSRMAEGEGSSQSRINEHENIISTYDIRDFTPQVKTHTQCYV